MLKTVAITSGGNGTVTQVGGTGTVNGLTLTGTVTTSGNLTLGGTLDLSSPPAIGGTTAAAGSFTTLNSSGNTRLGGLSGNQSLQVNNVASAVNYAQIVGAVTGGAPTISAQGSDANISLALTAKGSGGHTFNTGGGQQFAVAQTASAVDYLQATGNSGGFPSLSAQGASTNVSMVYGTKGTGGHNFTTNGTSTNQLIVAHTASAVNYVRVTGGATGAAPTISAQGSDANIDLNLFTKGTGVLRFGTYTAGVIAQAGYITITDAGGTSRRLLVG
jgi:hypothetical protein